MYLDTRGINDEAEELALDVDLNLTQGSTASGTLGFLKMNFTDVNQDGGSGIRGHFGLDMVDGDGDGAWVLGEKLALELNASAYAQADLHAVVDTVAGEYLPSVSATIHYSQQLADVSLSTSSGARFDSGSPEIVLENVVLDVGSVFDSFLGDTFDTIYEVVEPMKPVTDLLLMEFNAGVTKMKFIDIAYLGLPARVVDNAKKVLEVIDSTIEFVETVHSLSDAGVINFGDFNLTEQFIEDPKAETKAEDVRGAISAEKRNAQTSPNAKKLMAGPDMKGLDKTTSKKKKKSSNKTATIKRYSIPVLEDPMSLLDFMLGRGEADLFWYDLPDLALDFEYSKTFPVFTGLNVGFFGQIAAYTNFDFGFDTSGLRQWMDTGFDLAESYRVFSGFYLDDHGQENTPQDLDEITLRAGVGAIASLGIGGLVEAGVKGGIEAEIGFDLNDKETQFLDDQAVGDGKLYGTELVERISHGPWCLFDVHGELSVFLEAFLWVGLDLGFSEITLFEARKRFVDVVLASFDFECVHEAPQHITDFSGNTLTLSYSGSDSGGAHNYTVDVLEVGEDLTMTRLMESGRLDAEYYTRAEEIALREKLAGWRDDGDLAGKDVILVSTGLRAELFLAKDVDTLTIVGTPYADRYNLRAAQRPGQQD